MISKRTKKIISKTLMAVMLSSMTLNGVQHLAYAQEATQQNDFESSVMVEHDDNEIVTESEWEGQLWLYEAVKSQFDNKAIAEVTYGDLLKVRSIKCQPNGNSEKRHIPKLIGYFKNAYAIELPNMGLEGSIPEELYTMKKLATLDISNNKVSGMISHKIGDLRNLTWFYINNNNFTGEFPKEIGNIPGLRTLIIGNNDFTGIFPKELRNLKLFEIDIQNTNITGTILENIIDMTELEKVNLSNSKFEGEIPVKIGQLWKLITLDLSNNNFTGTIPKEIVKSIYLKTLKLNDNYFTGPVPQEFSKQFSLQADISNNPLVGEYYAPKDNAKINYQGTYVNSSIEGINKLTPIKVKASVNEEVTIFQPMEDLGEYYDYDVEEKEGYYIMRQDKDRLSFKPTREGIINIKAIANFSDWGLTPYNGVTKSIRLEIDTEYNRLTIKLPETIKFEELTDLDSKTNKYLKEYINNSDVNLEVRVKNEFAYVTAKDEEDYHCNYYNSKLKKNILVQDIKIPIEKGTEDNSEQLQLEQEAKDAVVKAENTRKKLI